VNLECITALCGPGRAVKKQRSFFLARRKDADYETGGVFFVFFWSLSVSEKPEPERGEAVWDYKSREICRREAARFGKDLSTKWNRNFWTPLT
jgi:hypothetical protein